MGKWLSVSMRCYSDFHESSMILPESFYGLKNMIGAQNTDPQTRSTEHKSQTEQPSLCTCHV
jgi:hypothetical protein